MRRTPYPEPPDAADLFPDDLRDAAPAHRRERAGGTSARRFSLAAAAAIVIGGYVHFCLYRHGFRAIPKIGTAFLIQVLSSVVVAAALVIGREQVLHLGRRIVRRTAAVRMAGLMLSIGTLAAFGLTRTPAGLFNFMERGLQPAPQALIALVAESAAAVLLGVALMTDRLRPQASRHL